MIYTVKALEDNKERAVKLKTTTSCPLVAQFARDQALSEGFLASIEMENGDGVIQEVLAVQGDYK